MRIPGVSLVILASALATSAVRIEADIAKRSVSTAVYNNLVYYFQYASSSYSDTCANPNGNTLVGYLSSTGTDTQGLVARDDTKKEVVVAFRGTTSQVDFDTDFNFELVPLVTPGLTPPANTTAHPGFLGAYNSVQSQVFSLVSAQLSAHPGYAIVVTGHSLGGGIASIAGLSLKARFPSSALRLYTYGQPRTGNSVYAAYADSVFGANSFRSVHQADSVPTFVPRAFGYQHHGVEYWQNPDPASAASTTQCSGDESAICSDSIPSTAFINQDHLVYFGVFFVTTFCS